MVDEKLQLFTTKERENAECKFTAMFLTIFQYINSKNWLHTAFYYETIAFLNWNLTPKSEAERNPIGSSKGSTSDVTSMSKIVYSGKNTSARGIKLFEPPLRCSTSQKATNEKLDFEKKFVNLKERFFFFFTSFPNCTCAPESKH